MASVNKVILVGNLGKDPETRYAPSGEAICNITLATTDTWKDKNSGEKREATEWHRVAFFGKLAEIAGQYLRKGSQVYIEGSLRTRKWTDKENVERYTTETRADVMKMLGGKPEGERQQSEPQQRSQPAQRQQQKPQDRDSGGGFGAFDDDIPFLHIGSGASWRVI